MEDKFGISHTKLKTFRRCLQQYDWKYVDGIYPPSNVGMDRGTAGHKALAVWHNEHDAGKSTQAAFEWWSGMGYQEDEEWRLLLDALNRYYPWSTEHDEFQLVKDEYEFKIEFGTEEHTIIFNGFVDGIVEEKGRTWLLENKFYKRMDNSDKTMDIQSSLYMLATQLLGMEVAGVIYNMVRIGDTKIAITEPAVRQRVIRNPDGLERIQNELVYQAQAMLAYQEGGVPYRNSTKDCSWDCPFLSPCMSMMDDGLEPTEMLQRIATIRRNSDG